MPEQEKRLRAMCEFKGYEICDELKFTPEDILIKRDIDFINSIKYPEKYKEYNKRWEDFDRVEKASLIMGYIEDITLSEKSNSKCEVEYVKFRESIANTCNELYDKGFVDRTDYAIFGNIIGTLRYSEYRDDQEVWQHILRLREFYDVGFYQATYNVQNKIFNLRINENSQAIVRVFPMQDYRKIDPNLKMEEYELGILYINKDDGTNLEDKEAVFKFIPNKADGINTREVRTTTNVKPANMLGLEEFVDDDEDEEITDEVISS